MKKQPKTTDHARSPPSGTSSARPPAESWEYFLFEASTAVESLSPVSSKLGFCGVSEVSLLGLNTAAILVRCVTTAASFDYKRPFGTKLIRVARRCMMSNFTGREHQRRNQSLSKVRVREDVKGKFYLTIYMVALDKGRRACQHGSASSWPEYDIEQPDN